MTRTRTAAILTALAALCVTALAPATAPAGTTVREDTISFTATSAGKATVKVTDDVADISASGTGTATGAGASTVTGTGKGDASKQPCVPFTGTGVIKATSGTTTLSFSVVTGSQGCGDEAGKVFGIVGGAKVTGGTGTLAGSTGTLKLTGVYDRGAGTFSVKFKGSLTTAAAASAKTTLKITAGAKNKLAFSTKRLTARAGQVRIVMKNLSATPHNVAIRAGTSAKSKVLAKGKVVRKGKTSTVKATLKKASTASSAPCAATRPPACGASSP